MAAVMTHYNYRETKAGLARNKQMDEPPRTKNRRDALRQTGRTTRMMRHALAEAKKGRSVYVLFSTRAEVERYACTYMSMISATSGAIKLETPDSCGFDFESGRVRGSHPNCLFLVDHHVIESRFSNLVRWLEEFDA